MAAVLAFVLFCGAQTSSQTEPTGPAKGATTVTPLPTPSETPAPENAQGGNSVVPPDVSVSAIGNVDGPTVGLLDDANGGLGKDMWSGSSRVDLEIELSRIPIVTTDPVVRDLARRILLTSADTPLGPSHHALVTVRLQRLLDGGLVEEAGELASKVELPNDAEFTWVQAEALLYSARAQDVCSDKTSRRLQSAEAFWLELRAYCYLSQGDMAAADLTRSILAAQGVTDTGFTILLDELENNQPSAPGVIAHPTAVDVFLLRRMGLAVTPQIASQLGTAANVIAARDLRNPALERLSAAEHIVGTGALGIDELRAIADAQAFTPQQKANAREQASTTPFLMRQILLRQAAALDSRADDKFALIRRADPALNEQGPFVVFAGLESANVISIPPSMSSGQTSWLAARVLMLGGRPDAADGWLGPANNPLIAEAGLALDLLVPGAAHDSLAQTDLVWLATHATTDAGGWPSATALSIGLWNALGLALPPDAIQKGPATSQAFDGDLVTPVQMTKLNESAADHARRGEAILRLLNIIGVRGPARFAPDASAYIVATLEHLGLDLGARRLAAECLLLGPPLPHAPPTAQIQPLAPSPP